MAKDNNIERKSNIEILKGSGMSYLYVAVNMIAGIAYTPWMIQEIGQSDYGLYTIAISLISALMFDFGIGTALSRFAAMYRAKGDQDSLEKFAGLVYKLYLLIDCVVLVVAIVLFFNLEVLYANLSPDELARFKIVYILVMGYNLTAFPFTLLDGILNAYECFWVSKGCQLLARILTVILVVTALLNGGGLYALVLANIVSSLISIAIKWIMVHKRIGLHIQWRGADKAMLLSVFSFSVWSMISGYAQTMSTNLMPSLVAARNGAAEAAIYGAATTLNGYAWMLTSAIGGMFLPKVTRILFGNQDEASQRLDALSIKVGRLLLILCDVILVGFFCIGREFFVIWMGPDYERAYYAAAFLILAEMISYPTQIYSTAMTSGGYIKPRAINCFVTSCFILGAGIVLSQAIGAAGAAAAIAVGYIVRWIWDLILFKKHLHADVVSYLHQVYQPSVSHIILGIFLYFAMAVFPAHGWLLLLLKSCVIVVLYSAVTWGLYLNEKEKQLVYSFCRKVIKR